MGYSSQAHRINKANIALMTSRKKARRIKPKLSVVPFAKDRTREKPRLGALVTKDNTSPLVDSLLKALVVLALVCTFVLTYMALELFWNI